MRSGTAKDGHDGAWPFSMGKGPPCGLFGADVQFMAHPENGWISSMVAPLLSDWAEFDALRIDTGCAAFRRFGEQLDTFAAGAAGLLIGLLMLKNAVRSR